MIPRETGSGVLCGKCFRKHAAGDCGSAARLVSFGIALVAMRAGKRMRRASWSVKWTSGMWVRQIDLYADKEFQIHEAPSADGTWLPFLAIKTVDGRLAPWNATPADMLADDWEDAPES